MSKVIVPITAQVAIYDTDVPFKEVVARLETELDKAGSSDFIQRLADVKSHEEWLSAVNKRAPGKDFLYFSEFPHSLLLRYADPEGKERSGVVAYMFGNPSIANGIMEYNPLAAYSIPPRFLIVEKPEGGTTVTYHLPSSVMVVPGKENDSALVTKVKGLDAKLEKLADKITAT